MGAGRGGGGEKGETERERLIDTFLCMNECCFMFCMRIYSL